MKKKITKILYKNQAYGQFDYKVELECHHTYWHWGIPDELKINDEVECHRCNSKDHHSLEILK